MPATGPELWLARPDREPVRFAFEDQPRDDAAGVIETLKDRGYGIELVSGDRSAVVAALAKTVGIEHWQAESRPRAKTERLSALAAVGRKPVMIGDGLNDAPALAAAHASMSPVAAADVSRAAADILFQGDALAPVIEALHVARRSRRLMVQNFALALGYNGLAVPLAMAGLVTPLIAAAAMSASSLVVTVNAFRLHGWRT